MSKELPVYPFKKLLIPQEEVLFNFQGTAERRGEAKPPKQAIFGITPIDLRALLLYNHVFEKDSYYQARLRNTMVIGYGYTPFLREDVCGLFSADYEENILEHLQFDIFLQDLTKGSAKKFKVLTGSEEGQRVLEKIGYQNYEHVQFAGPIREEGIEPRTQKIYQKLKKMKPSDKLWQDLGKQCIECGKCTLSCPTCFCFRIDDQPELKGHTKRVRCWDTCFYHEFSEVADELKFLKTTAERIYFWYFHKFVRIMDEFSFPGGCVGCGRCSRVCPVEIEINKVIKNILKA